MSSDPIDIRETSPTELVITWADQHKSLYSYAWLREHCPCAMCRSRHQEGGVDDLLASMVRPDMSARDIQTVGRYALNIAFADGHDSGIFTFDMLRAECPCEGCAQSRSPG
jgi:prepilin-type processing-associated H-X9-DG protein